MASWSLALLQAHTLLHQRPLVSKLLCQHYAQSDLLSHNFQHHNLPGPLHHCLPLLSPLLHGGSPYHHCRCTKSTNYLPHWSLGHQLPPAAQALSWFPQAIWPSLGTLVPSWDDLMSSTWTFRWMTWKMFFIWNMFFKNDILCLASFLSLLHVSVYTLIHAIICCWSLSSTHTFPGTNPWWTPVLHILLH